MNDIADAALYDLGELTPSEVAADVDAFLDSLPGACLFRRRGRAAGRRAVVGLLHGNEPSGLVAIHALLRRTEPPHADTLCMLGAVHAARTLPRYAHRMLPNARDLNRCFAQPYVGQEGAVAHAMLETLRAFAPEGVVDLHNNSGHNPAYAVGTRLDAQRLGIAGLFTERYVYTTLRLGSLMEAIEDTFPIVTIECGRAKDPVADDVARQGLFRFVDAPMLPTRAPGDRDLRLFGGLIRVQLAPGLRIAFARGPRPDFDLTFDSDVDRHNFQPLAAGTPIAWVRRGGTWPVQAFDSEGREVSREWFAVEDGALTTLRPLMPMMMTTNPQIAVSDCLFYVVQELG